MYGYANSVEAALHSYQIAKIDKPLALGVVAAGFYQFAKLGLFLCSCGAHLGEGRRGEELLSKPHMGFGQCAALSI